MISEVINEEHVPEKPSIFAGIGHVVEIAPDWPISNKRCDFPEDEEGQHVGGPDSDDTMYNPADIKFSEISHLLQLL
jgi:hypothetical protein